MVHEVCLGFGVGAPEDIEKARLERHLDQARGQALDFDLEELAGLLVGGDHVPFHIQQERHHRRELEQRAEGFSRSRACFRLVFVAASIPDHGRSI